MLNEGGEEAVPEDHLHRAQAGALEGGEHILPSLEGLEVIRLAAGLAGEVVDTGTDEEAAEAAAEVDQRLDGRHLAGVGEGEHAPAGAQHASRLGEIGVDHIEGEVLEDIDREGLIEAAVGERQAAGVSFGERHPLQGLVSEERGGVAAHHEADFVGVPDGVFGGAAAVVEHRIAGLEAQHAAQGAVADACGEQGWGKLTIIELLGQLLFVGDILGDVAVGGLAGHEVDIAVVEGVEIVATRAAHTLGDDEQVA